MTTHAFNLWASRYLAALEARMAEYRAGVVLKDQRTACATTCRIVDGDE